MNEELAKKLANLPRTPGVYFHKSNSGEIIYVGKAASLRNRVKQYFQNSREKDLKTQALVAEIVDTDWVETESEIDALFLESEMVKRYMPRYNVLLRDDKSQSFVRIDIKSHWPYVGLTRNPADDGAEYFGPFYNSYALKKALRYLRPIFPHYVREPGKHQSKLEMQIGLNPDVGAGSEAYKANLRKLISYIKGNRKTLTGEIEKDMKKAASMQHYEQAAKLRNRLHHMKELQRKVMFGDREFLDISKDKALSDLKLLLSLPATLKRIEGYDISHMGGTNVVASMVVFTNGVSDRAEYRKFKTRIEHNNDTYNMNETLLRRLSPKNIASWGKPDLLLIDGGKGQLMAAIEAQEARATAFAVISIAKREEEIIIHRTRSNINTAAIEALRFSPPAGVAVVKEGDFLILNLHAGQLNASSHSKNLRGGIQLSPYSDITKLFQRIRDESHRFAVSYHTVLKRKKATASSLEEIPGIGPATRKKLMQDFGSLKGIKAASPDQLAKSMGTKRATAILKYL